MRHVLLIFFGLAVTMGGCKGGGDRHESSEHSKEANRSRAEASRTSKAVEPANPTPESLVNRFVRLSSVTNNPEALAEAKHVMPTDEILANSFDCPTGAKMVEKVKDQRNGFIESVQRGDVRRHLRCSSNIQEIDKNNWHKTYPPGEDIDGCAAKVYIEVRKYKVECTEHVNGRSKKADMDPIVVRLGKFGWFSLGG